MKDVNFGAAKTSRVVYSIRQISPAEPGTMLVWYEPYENENMGRQWTITTASVLSWAIVEQWREHTRKDGGPHEYVGPSFLTEVVPVYQGPEGIVQPYNEGSDIFSGALVITPLTTIQEICNVVTTSGKCSSELDECHAVDAIERAIKHKRKGRLSP